MSILPPPVAFCTSCGRTSRNIEVINNRCASGKGCKGTMSSALNVGDWEACPACSGSGRAEEGRCEQCNGDGHLIARKR